MNRRRPLLPFDYQQGLDIEPQQYAPPAMLAAQMPPPLQFAPMPTDDSMKQLAQMGTQRALAQLLNPKKKSATAKDALAAWEAGGSL